MGAAWRERGTQGEIHNAGIDVVTVDAALARFLGTEPQEAPSARTGDGED
jgi:hypothetical protein